MFVRCMAGVRRAPVLLALLLSATQWSVKRIMTHVRQKRAVDFEGAFKGFEPRGGRRHKKADEDLQAWLHRMSKTLRTWQLGIPLRVDEYWVASRGSKINAIHMDAPICKWRGAKSR